jgi:hypothetical protein
MTRGFYLNCRIPAFDRLAINCALSFKKKLAFFSVSNANNAAVKKTRVTVASQSCDVQKLHCRLAATLEETKEFYNENYEEILQTLFPEQLLKILSSYILNAPFFIVLAPVGLPTLIKQSQEL